MAIKHILCSFLISLFFPCIIFAQDSLDWEKCQKIAFENNSSLKIKKLTIEEYRYKYLAGLNDYYPSINISHSARRSGSDSSASNSFSTGLSASEKIFSLKTLSSIKTRKISYEKMILSYYLESSNLRYELANAFMNFLIAQEKVKVDSKNMDMRETNAKLLKLKYESGRESRGDAMYANALYELAKTNLQSSKRAFLSAQRKLAQYLNLSLDVVITAHGEFKIPPVHISFEKALANIEKTPQIMLLKKDIESAKEAMFSAKYDLYPTLSASQSLSWSGDREFPSSNSWSLGLSLSLPLFSGGITHYRNNTKAAKLNFKSANENFRNEVSLIKTNLATAYDDFLNAIDAARTQDIMLRANEERYKETQVKYMAGKLSFLDLENIEQNLVDARLNRLEYIKNANFKKNYLNKLLGIELSAKE
ncbi:MAG: TolC family protein [Elusimicrobia bacterium]|nr:TolC family protein [Elusimicrobiota bacterium]